MVRNVAGVNLFGSFRMIKVWRSSRGLAYVTLSEEHWERLLKASGVRSKKRRIQKKAVKREMQKAIYRFTDKLGIGNEKLN